SGFRILRLPLRNAGRALGKLPFVLEQVLEEVVAPFRRRLGPGDFRTTGNRVGSDARTVLALPPEALVLDGTAFGVGANQRRVASTMGLAEGVAARYQRNGLLVIHRHPEERFADVLGGRDRIRIAVRSRRIYLGEAHL